MKHLTIKRTAYTQYGTFGALALKSSLAEDGVPFAVTLEDPWNDNAPFDSCIPTGTYRCVRVLSPRFNDTFEITEVESRDHILFHKGNTEKDTVGCVLVGEQYEKIAGVPGIAHSGKGYGEFMDMLEGEDEFILTITD